MRAAQRTYQKEWKVWQTYKMVPHWCTRSSAFYIVITPTTVTTTSGIELRPKRYAYLSSFGKPRIFAHFLESHIPRSIRVPGILIFNPKASELLSRVLHAIKSDLKGIDLIYEACEETAKSLQKHDEALKQADDQPRGWVSA